MQGAPAITDLLNASDVWSLAESAIGAGQIRSVDGGQIALRFPSQEPVRAPHPHLDGMYTPTNGVPKGVIRNFTALVGVVLSRIPHDDVGNLTVWPGTHRQYERYFRERGPEALLEACPPFRCLPRGSSPASPATPSWRTINSAMASPATRRPTSATPSTSASSTSTTTAIHWECMTDIWREWDGMRDVIAAP